MDKEISKICWASTCSSNLMNARYALNASNARWGSLYNALYGTDVIPETRWGKSWKKYNPIRGEKVIEYARNVLDANVSL